MWGEGGKMETIIIFANLFIVVQAVTSAIMCVYGYKWSKGLIAVMSSYVGVALGTVISMILIDGGVGFEILIIIPICAVAFSKLAYEIVALNHFLAGFLLAVKIAFMILTKMYENSMIEDSEVLFILPIGIGIIAGVASYQKFNKYILVACVTFIGVTEFVPKLFEFINGSLFVATGDISFIFDPITFILSLFGIEIPSGGEVLCMLVLGVASFYYQKNKVDKLGIDFSNKIIDDRN